MTMAQDLYSFLCPPPAAQAPLITIYSPKTSPRLDYVCGFIFNRVLQVPYVITHQLTEFEKAAGPRISYSTEVIAGVVSITPHTLLFETGISTQRPVPAVKKDQLYIYETSGASGNTMPFDVFAAVFYFISRYEEWQPHEKDQHGRFEASACLLFQQGFHLKPVVDQWIAGLAKRLTLTFQGLQWPQRAFRAMSTIDVDNLYAYRAKGPLRVAGALLRDLMKADFFQLKKRMQVLLGKEKDPFDVYEEVSAFCQAQGIPLACFFLFRTGTPYDRTVDPASGAFAPVLATLQKNKSAIGLHPSYDSLQQPAQLQKEVKQFSTLLKEPVRASRQHYLRFDIKSTPAHLLAQGIRMDFTMGFASRPGFRAGTSHPFFYYDFLAEKVTDLLLVPFCAMDGAYMVYDRVNADAAYESLMQLAQEIKNVQGLFVTVFHERTFFDHLYPGFGPLYKKLHLALKQI